MIINVKRITRLAILISMALSLHVLESYIPVPFAFPGVKLGLANIITIYGIVFFGLKDTMIIITSRCFLGSLFAGNLAGFFFSITGGVFSGLIMFFLYSKAGQLFSIQIISVIGGITHNVGQLLTASLIVENFRVFYYMPVLVVSGIIMGLFVGIVSASSFAILKTSKILT